MCREHTDFFLSFAQRWGADVNLGGLNRQDALAALGSDQDNLRAALRWCVEHGEAEKGLSLGRAHWIFWVMRGLFTEGQAWLTQLAALPGAATAPALRAAALSIAAGLARRQGSFAAALEIYEEVLPLLRQTHDPLVLESALLDLGVIAMQRGDVQAAQAHLEESLASARAAGHLVTEALLLHYLAQLALRQEAYTTARGRAEEGLTVARAAGDIAALSLSLNSVGSVMLRLGDLTLARRLLEEAVDLQRQIGERFLLANSQQHLGQLATAEAHYAEARARLRESLRLRQDLGTWLGISESFDGIAELAAAEGQPTRAVQLAGATASLREAIGVPLYPLKRTTLANWLVPLRQSLGSETVRLAWAVGREMPRDQALELALALTDAPHERLHRPLDRSGHHGMVLSVREQEVAASLADGLSNREIARRLVITECTVKAHVEHILDKLGLTSRTQIALWAAEHDLPARNPGEVQPAVQRQP
jgi:ATP/maltotriose-dependent transcriptional regulator MalT